MASGDATQKRSHAKTAERWAGHVRRKHQPASAQAAASGGARPSGAKLRQLDVRAITRPAHDCPEGAPAGRLRGKCPGARNASVARASGAPARARSGAARGRRWRLECQRGPPTRRAQRRVPVSYTSSCAHFPHARGGPRAARAGPEPGDETPAPGRARGGGASSDGATGARRSIRRRRSAEGPRRRGERLGALGPRPRRKPASKLGPALRLALRPVV